MTTTLAKQNDAPLAPAPGSEVAQLIRFALEKGQNPTELYAILSQERTRQELQAYNRAKGDFLEMCPRIVEKKIGGGITKSGKDFKFPYADLGDIIEQAFPALRELGFSWDFSLTVLGDGKQYQRCFLRHRDGYVHQADVPYLSDSGGHMNAVQQVGSGLSYSQRYALLQALGLPTTKMDVDAPPPPKPRPASDRISPEQYADLSELLCDLDQTELPKFLAYMKADSLGAIAAVDYKKALDALNRKIAATK